MSEIAPDIIRLSPNFNDAPPAGAVVIIHATRSGVPLNPTEFEGTLNYMETPGTVSYQWLIARDGRKARVVPDDKQAWHAAEDNDRWGIGLEQGAESDGFPAAQMASLVEVCRGYVAMGVPPRHAAGTHESGFVGHEETAQGLAAGKSDPGRGFDWSAFLAALQEQEEDDGMMTPAEIQAWIEGHNTWHAEQVHARLAGIEARQDGHDSWHGENVHPQLAALESRLTALKSRLTALERGETHEHPFSGKTGEAVG